MPTEPVDFDSNRSLQVLRLRFRDWGWPTALLLAAAAFVLGASELERPPGSLGFLISEWGPGLFGVLLVVAGVRWCWIGRIRSPRADRCGRCDYQMTGLDPSDSTVRCPECGADGRQRRASRPVPLARVLIDLPGVLVALAGSAIATISMLYLLSELPGA